MLDGSDDDDHNDYMLCVRVYVCVVNTTEN